MIEREQVDLGPTDPFGLLPSPNAIVCERFNPVFQCHEKPPGPLKTSAPTPYPVAAVTLQCTGH